MSEWRPVQLADLIDVKHGFAFAGEFFASDGPGDLLATPGNFAIGGGFQWGRKKYYRGPVTADFVLQPRDLIVTMTDLSKGADTLGYSAIVPEAKERLLHNQRVGKVLQKNSDADLGYLYWLLRSRGYRDEILASATGSTVKHTSPKRILAFRFLLPSKWEQRGIAAALSAIDDKIDLNRRMNETLEAMARAIFKDWFVDFGPTRAKMEGHPPYLAPDLWALFPDRLNEKGKPEAWKVGSFGDEFLLTMGQSPPGETYNSSGDGLPFFQGRTDFGERFPSRRIYCSAPTRLAEPNDTLVSVRAPVGDLNMAWEKSAIGRGVAAARHKAGHRGYTYYTLSSLRPALEAFDHEGTIFGAINKAQFVALQVAVPKAELIDAFEALVTSIDDRIRANVSETHTLVSARDLLLPNLMSGKVRISEVEKAVEAVL